MRKAGLRELWELRGASVVGSTLAGLLGLVAFSVLARSWLVGGLAAYFYCLSASFWGYPDSVHMNVWMQIGLFSFLLAWVGFERTRGPRRWALLGLAAIAYFFEIWMTLEHVLLIALVVAVRTIMSRRWGVWIGAAILAAACLAGLASRVWHLTFEFGGQGAFDYLLGKYEHRSGEGGGAGGGGGDGVGLAEVLKQWLVRLYWTPAGDPTRRPELGYPFLHLPVLVTGAALVATMLLARLPLLHAALARARHQAREVARSLGRAQSAARLTGRDALDVLADSRLPSLRAARAALGWGALLLLASLHWHVGMRQHAQVHEHVILNMLPGMALILGALAAAGLRLAMPDSRGAGWARWLGPPLAIALLAIFGSHLQYGGVLNRLFPVNRSMHRELLERAGADQWWRDLGSSLRQRYPQIRRVVLFHWGPRQANLMGLPHQYVEGGRMSEAFGLAAPGSTEPAAAADLLMIEFPRRARTPRAILEDGMDRLGFPEIDEGPESTTLFFSPRRWEGSPATVECDIRFAGGLRIERVRLSEAITGRAWALCFLVRGPNAAAFAPSHATTPGAATNPGRLPGEPLPPDALPPQALLPTGVPQATLAALVRTFDAGGTRTGVFAPRLARRATYRNRSLVWVIIDKHRLVEGGQIRIALTTPPSDARVALERGRILAPGMTVDLETDEIVWKVDLP